MIWTFAHFAKRLVFQWLDRRSQRKSFTWTAFAVARERWTVPDPRVIEKPWPRTAGQYRPRGL